jgi:hypothetical protein
MLKRLFGAIISSSPDPDVIRAREGAYQDAFGSNVQILHSTDRKIPHIDVYVFPPSHVRDYTVLVTGGMSDVAMQIPTGAAGPANIELILGIGQHQHWASNLLKIAAEYPSAQGTFFAAHHTLPFGGELGEGSSLSAFLFIEPRILPPTLSDWVHRDPRVGFLQVVPITTEEHAFAVSKGSEELETLLAKAGFLIMRDANRPSVVTARGA